MRELLSTINPLVAVVVGLAIFAIYGALVWALLRHSIVFRYVFLPCAFLPHLHRARQVGPHWSYDRQLAYALLNCTTLLCMSLALGWMLYALVATLWSRLRRSQTSRPAEALG